MVYCDLIKYDSNTVTYAFGADPRDITGRFVFNYQNSTLNIVKEPENGMVPIRHIHRMLRKNQPRFISG